MKTVTVARLLVMHAVTAYAGVGAYVNLTAYGFKFFCISSMSVQLQYVCVCVCVCLWILVSTVSTRIPILWIRCIQTMHIRLSTT